MIKLIFRIVMLVLLFCHVPAGYAAETPGEYRVKAAYLYNFAKFIRWPDAVFANERAPLVIGVLGENPFNGELGPLAEKKVRTRSIDVRYYAELSEIEDCHLLYISQSETKNLTAILKALALRQIVTVGDTHNFVDSGGIIQFVTKRDRLRFSINLGVAKQNNIQIKAQLLGLAAEVLEVVK